MLNDFSDFQIDSFSIKPTLGCNLRCDYCYCHGGAADMLQDCRTMNPEVLHRLLDSYRQLVCKQSRFVHSDGFLPLVWHGGEPLLAGVEKFQEYFKIEKEFEDHLSIHNVVQTNLTLLSSAWINFFKFHQVILGISLDGNADMHDTHRKKSDGRGSYEIVIKKLKKIREEKIPFGTIGVVTGKNQMSATTIYNHMKEIGVNYYDWTPAIFDGEHECVLTNKEYTNFFSGLFDVWMNASDGNCEIKIINDIVAVMKYEKKTASTCPRILCEFSGRCGNAMSVLPNGDIFPCECLVNLPRFRLGNILEQSLEDILEGEKFEYFVREFNDVSPECMECQWFGICKGGCLHRRAPECVGSAKKDYFCPGRKALFSHIKKRLFHEK